MHIKKLLLLLLVSTGSLMASWQQWLKQPIESDFKTASQPAQSWYMKGVRPYDVHKKDLAADRNELTKYLNRWGRLVAEEGYSPQELHNIRKKLWATNPDLWRSYSFQKEDLNGNVPQEFPKRWEILDSFADYGKTARKAANLITKLDDDLRANQLAEQLKYSGLDALHDWYPHFEPHRRSGGLGADARADYFADMDEMRQVAAQVSELKDLAYRYYLDEQARASHEGTLR